MTYYNTLIADKLKIISEIKRTNSLIDEDKKESKDFSCHIERLEVFKKKLQELNSLIISFQLSQNDIESIDTMDSLVQESPMAPITPIENDTTDSTPSAGLLE